MPNASSRMQEQRRLWRKLRVPISVFFELTPRCTLDCKMCYVHLTREQMGTRRELSTEQWLRIVDEAISAGMLYGVLTGGECMLHEGFWQIYDRLIDGGVVLSVNTNGYALTDADIARFAEKPPASIRITLYGASEESYEQCTGRRAFSRVVENIRKLKAAGISPKLNTTLSKFNYQDIIPMTQLAKELGLRMKYAFDLFEPNEDTGRSSESFSLPLREMVEAEQTAWAAQGRALLQNPPVDAVPERQPEDPSCRGLVCAAGRTSCTVHWDGRFAPCLNIPCETNILDRSFAEAWEEAKALADAFVLPVECRSCKLQFACSPCPAFRQDPKDPGHCNPARCAATMARYRGGVASAKRPERSAGEFDQDDIHESL